MKRLLVTGASGFLGSRIVEFYKDKFEIFAPTHAELDITDEKDVLVKFEEWNPDYVIHCAAISAVARCEQEPDMSWKINVEGSIHIAKASAKIHAKCIICSSDQIYFGSTENGPHKETECVLPYNVYGREKLKAEEACLAIDADCVLLRLSWMYDRKTLYKQEHSDFMRMLLDKMRTEEVLLYPVHDIRGITDVNEVVENLEKMFTVPGGVYNFGSPNKNNTYDTVYEVFSELGLDTQRLQRNEDAFMNNPRDISMCQQKLNACGIYFSTTKDAMLRNIKEGLSSNDE